MYRRRNKHLQEEVQLNLAAMLDMAFQLLAFFILTFRPSPIEGHLAMRLPKPGTVSSVAASSNSADSSEAVAAEVKESFLVIVYADVQRVSKVTAVPGGDVFDGSATSEHLARLNRTMSEAFGQAALYEQVEIVSDPALRYDELMKVVDICLRQQMPDGSQLQNISFSKLRVDAPTP